MSDFEPRMVKFRVMGASVLLASLAFMIVCLVGLIVSEKTLGSWVIAFVASLLGGFIGFSFYGLTRLLIAIESNTFRIEETLVRLLRHMDEVKEGVHAVNESILLSEDAKSIAFRDKDLQALRHAVEEEIATKDWEAAIYLADQMGKRFGMRQEAEQFRERVTRAREEEYRQALTGALSEFDERLKVCDWESAAAMIEPIRARFTGAPEAKNLSEKLEQARLAKKKELIQQWDDAIQKNEVDRGIEILKELDHYLAPNEAAAFEESARGAFRTKLHNMGVKFSLLVTEKIWDQALELGREIIAEFPNSRMAQEIQERLAGLEGKAQAMREERETEKV